MSSDLIILFLICLVLFLLEQGREQFVMRSLIGDGFQILKGPLRWLSWQNFLTSGTFSLRLC
jgi:hypothetical protein